MENPVIDSGPYISKLRMENIAFTIKDALARAGLEKAEEIIKNECLKKSDFENIHDPNASVKSIQETLISVLNALRRKEESND